MHSSPASRSKSHHRHKAPITTLLTLCALALPAALVPTTATAMDDQGGAGECRSFAGAPPGAGWNGTEFCTLTDGSAGGGGGATGGDGSGGGTVGNEVIVIVDPYSPPQPTNPLCKSARHCLPGQSGGGRPLGIEGDGPSRGGPRAGGGTGSGKQGETTGKGGKGAAGKKSAGMPKAPASKRACQAIASTLAELDYQTVLAYKNLRQAHPRPRKGTFLSPNPFLSDPVLDAKIPGVDKAIAAWRTGLCRGQLPGALPLGI